MKTLVSFLGRTAIAHKTASRGAQSAGNLASSNKQYPAEDFPAPLRIPIGSNFLHYFTELIDNSSIADHIADQHPQKLNLG
jgi:hypothetical protein